MIVILTGLQVVFAAPMFARQGQLSNIGKEARQEARQAARLEAKEARQEARHKTRLEKIEARQAGRQEAEQPGPALPAAHQRRKKRCR